MVIFSILHLAEQSSRDPFFTKGHGEINFQDGNILSELAEQSSRDPYLYSANIDKI
jgi:hypothetical protein